MNSEPNAAPDYPAPRKKRRPCNRPRVSPAPWDRNKTRPETTKVSLSPGEFIVLRLAGNSCDKSVAAFMREAGLEKAARLFFGVPAAPQDPAEASAGEAGAAPADVPAT